MTNNMKNDFVTPTAEEIKKQQLIEVLTSMIKRYSKSREKSE
ncbi:hypothetical protein J2Z32_002973 [Paenibacillus turicensis]|uniref:Uncharacterized protein n=1 Tax=Paenibacillus turicensis TaxID=160487 RepID=A0ABS4FUV9_9BACL|nr:hypothetical protein [Paenibacillus turicensis]MBP1906324.1 hypothetical protein [Paenibacillus turicensis]